MSSVRILNSSLNGTLKLPESKSDAHRALICARLAGSSVEIRSKSEDITATENALDTVFGGGNTVDCGESGSTLRFLIPLAAALGKEITFTGGGRLGERPLDEYLLLLPEHGVKCERGEGFILRISGKLTPGLFEIKGDVSSQYITGLLFSLPLLEGESEIRLTTALQSKPYIDMTVNTLKRFGIRVDETENGWKIKGSQCYKPASYTVESDWSQAAFFLAGGVLSGRVTLEGLNNSSPQGDREIVNVLRRFGAVITSENGRITAEKSQLKGININVSDIPDAVPAVAVLAAFANGKTVITGGERLRLKESDRIKSVVYNLNKMGISAVETSDGMIITGGTPKGAELCGFNDHRIVMAFAVAALAAKGETLISDSESVNKSYPAFFADYRALGGRADVISNGQQA